LFLAILLVPSLVVAKGLSVEEQFKKSFPKNHFESITPTAVNGIYEVYSADELYYYMPKGDILIYGSLVNKDGINLTRESHLKKMAKKMTAIPLDGALKTGTGKITVVEFMDPNCYHCRQAYNYFSKRQDVNMNIFFFPLSQDSVNKIKHILCAKDSVKTYEDVMSGKLDSNAQLTACSDQNVEEKIKAHIQYARQVGLRGTPLFYIKGEVVDGFDPPVIEKLLNTNDDKGSVK